MRTLQNSNMTGGWITTKRRETRDGRREVLEGL
jgi:hypothetical protein